MKCPTYKSIKKAAKKSENAALDSGIQKYTYLLSLDKDQVKALSEKFLKQGGCALCIRYTGSGKCPLLKNCYGVCMVEWEKMATAYIQLCDGYDSYDEFMCNAGKILTKLLELKGIVK